jgi:hypothetical protein
MAKPETDEGRDTGLEAELADRRPGISPSLRRIIYIALAAYALAALALWLL